MVDEWSTRIARIQAAYYRLKFLKSAFSRQMLRLSLRRGNRKWLKRFSHLIAVMAPHIVSNEDILRSRKNKFNAWSRVKKKQVQQLSEAKSYSVSSFCSAVFQSRHFTFCKYIYRKSLYRAFQAQ